MPISIFFVVALMVVGYDMEKAENKVLTITYGGVENFGSYTGEMKNSKPHGICKGYKASGKLKSEFEWKDGKMDGIVKLYRESGRKPGRLWSIPNRQRRFR